MLLLAENRIRDAMEKGEFDHLEGAGRPLPGLDVPGLDELYDPNWWIRKWMRRERLSSEVKEGLGELRRKRSATP